MYIAQRKYRAVKHDIAKNGLLRYSMPHGHTILRIRHISLGRVALTEDIFVVLLSLYITNNMTKT